MFDTMDADGHTFSCRVSFSFGGDLVTQFTLDDAADLSSDWEQRFDNALFDDGGCRWPQ